MFSFSMCYFSLEFSIFLLYSPFRVKTMGARENLQRLADRKTQEIVDLERQIDRARAYLQAIQDSIKALPKDQQTQGSPDERPAALRPGSVLARTKEAIQKHGQPMHINSIFEAVGLENTKKARVSLIGSLGNYVRKGAVFTRTAPNTFGLVGMSVASGGTAERTLPEMFGKLTEGV